VLKFIKSAVIGLTAMFSVVSFGAPKVVLTEKNLVVLRGSVTSESVAKISHQILSSPEKELYLYISSPGGSVIAGQSLIYAIQTSGKKIHCVVSVGISMAFSITQGCTTRLVMPHSIMMQHVASYGLEGQDPNNRTFLKFLTDMLEEMDKAQAERLGLSLKVFKEKTRDDWWLYGTSAVKNKAADSVAEVSCSRELAQKTYREKIRVFVFSVDVEWSACPLIEGPLKVGSDAEERARRDGATPDLETLLKIRKIIENLNTYEVIEKKFRKNMDFAN